MFEKFYVHWWVRVLRRFVVAGAAAGLGVAAMRLNAGAAFDSALLVECLRAGAVAAIIMAADKLSRDHE